MANPDLSSPQLLNPFVFPPETKGRFRMLVMAAFALACSLGMNLVAVPEIPSIPADISIEQQEVMDKVIARQTEQLTAEDATKVQEILGSYGPMMVYRPLRIVLSTLIVLLIFAGTAALYVLHARSMRRRYQPQPIAPEQAPTVVAELQRLAARLGMLVAPSLEYRSGFLDGLAFGRPEHEVVVLGGQPVLIERLWGKLGRAVALHEMGHIANDDVRIREISGALLRMLLLAILALFAVSTAVAAWRGEFVWPLLRGEPRPWAAALGGGAKLVLIWSTVAWMWAELIRVREFYADWRVASWGFREPLLARLRLPGGAGSVPGFGVVGEALRRGLERLGLGRWLTRARDGLRTLGFRHHPTNQRRSEVLLNPKELFRVTLDLAFLSGLLMALFFGQLASLLNDIVFFAVVLMGPVFMLVGPFALLIPLGAAFFVVALVCHLVTGALGTQVQRESVVDLVAPVRARRRFARLLIPALIFAAGWEVGILLSIPNAFRGAATTIAWVAGLTLLVWLWLVHLRALADLRFGSHWGAEPPDTARRRRAWLSALLLACGLGPFLAMAVTQTAAAQPGFLTPPVAVGHQLYPIYVEGVATLSRISLALALMAALALGTFSWLAEKVNADLRKQRCPACSVELEERQSLQSCCKGCGSALASWMYVAPGDFQILQEVVT